MTNATQTGRGKPSMKPELRLALRVFAEQMEALLRLHDPKKGDSWKNCDFMFLMQKLTEEYAECILRGNPKEFVDLANICMMIWSRSGVDSK